MFCVTKGVSEIIFFLSPFFLGGGGEGSNKSYCRFFFGLPSHL